MSVNIADDPYQQKRERKKSDVRQRRLPDQRGPSFLDNILMKGHPENQYGMGQQGIKFEIFLEQQKAAEGDQAAQSQA